MNFGSEATDFIVRVHARDGNIVGTGFFLSDQTILTCAHVITDAGVGPGDTVEISMYGEMKFGELPQRQATVVQQHWRAPEAEDLAILQLVDPLRTVGRLFRAPGLIRVVKPQPQQSFSTFGFPLAKNIEGLPGICTFVENSSENGFTVFVLRSDEVSLGFSGAPLWVDNRRAVVGVIVSVIRTLFDPQGRQYNTCFAIPTETIWAAYTHLRPAAECPFQSLEFFGVEKKSLYFGRNAIVQSMIAALETKQFLAVIGISGSGKSSLVRAGLQKGLAAYASQRLRASRTIVLTPGSRPLVNLVLAVEAALPAPDTHDGGLNPLFPELPIQLDSDVPVSVIVERLKKALYGTHTILVIDQFEQCFSADSPLKTDRFLEAVRDTTCSDITVLIALRADFFGVILARQDVAAMIPTCSMTVTQLTPEELRETIEEPAAAAGVSIEPRLVEELILETNGRPGDLPLLEFALTEIWKIDADKGWLSLATFHSLGFKPGTPAEILGIKGTVVRRAEDEWEQLTTAEQDLAKILFMHLVSVSASSLADQHLLADSSRRSWASEWSPEMVPVVDKLAASFLLTRGSDPSSQSATVQVSHEAVIRSWPRLQRWIAEYRPYLLWQDEVLTPNLRNWIRNKQRPTDLLDEVQVGEAELWLAKYPLFFKGVAGEFAKTSIVRRDQQRAAERLRRKIVLRIAIAAASVFTLLSALLIHEWSVAEDTTTSAYHTRALGFAAGGDYLNAEVYFAAEATKLESHWFHKHTDDLIAAQTGFVEAAAHGLGFIGVTQSGIGNPVLLRGPFSVGARTQGVEGSYLSLLGSVNGVAVLQNLNNLKSRQSMADGAQDFYLAAESARSPRYAIGLRTGEILLFDPETIPLTSVSIAACSGPSQGPVSSIALSADGHRAVVGCEQGEGHVVRVFDVSQTTHAREMYEIAGFNDPVKALAISPDGQLVASGCRDRSVKMWRLEKGPSSLQELGKHQDVVLSVAFSADSRFLASGAKDLTIKVYDLASRAEKLLIGSQGGVAAVSFSPNGRFLASIATDREVRLWNVASGKEWAKLDVCAGAVASSPDVCGVPVSVQFESDYRVFASMSSGLVAGWDIDHDNGEVEVLSAHSGPANVAEFSPDGKWLATGGQDGKVVLWDANNLSRAPQVLSRPARQDNVIWVAFSRDSMHLAGGDENNHVYVWALDGRSVIDLGKQEGSVWALDYSYGGLLAVGDGLGCVHFWKENGSDAYINADVNRPLSEKYGVCSPTHSPVLGITFSDDQIHFATAHRDGTVDLWKLGVPTGPVSQNYKGAVWSVSFSPGGGRYLASGGEDEKVHRFDILKEQKADLGAHDGEVWTLAFSKQGVLASGGEDGCLRLWNFKDGRTVTIRDRDATILGLGFAPSGDHLALAELDGTVHVWHLKGLRSLLDEPASEMLKRAEHDSSISFSQHDKKN